jgi:hypothetical protein
MINVYKLGDKLIGSYKVFITNEELQRLGDSEITSYYMNNLIEELKKEDTSGLFEYKILEVKKMESEDLYGMEYEIIFEFIPDKIFIEESKLVAERLQIGL